MRKKARSIQALLALLCLSVLSSCVMPSAVRLARSIKLPEPYKMRWRANKKPTGVEIQIVELTKSLGSLLTAKCVLVNKGKTTWGAVVIQLGLYDDLGERLATFIGSAQAVQPNDRIRFEAHAVEHGSEGEGTTLKWLEVTGAPDPGAPK